MKKLLYFILAFFALWYINNMLGPLITGGIVLLIVLFIIWNRRGAILVFLAAQEYFIKGNVEKGEKYYQKAYKSGLMTPDGKISYSSFCLREGRFEKGKRLLNEVINSSRSTTQEKINAKHNLAVLVWKEGNLDEAISIIDIVHKEMSSTNSYGTRGVLYLEKAKRDKSFADVLDIMLEAYDYNEDDKTIADNLGELYLLMGEFEKAKSVYEKLLSKELITPMPYFNYALVLKNLGDVKGAEENLKKALDCRFTTVLTITKETIQKELDALENASQE